MPDADKRASSALVPTSFIGHCGPKAFRPTIVSLVSRWPSSNRPHRGATSMTDGLLRQRLLRYQVRLRRHQCRGKRPSCLRIASHAASSSDSKPSRSRYISISSTSSSLSIIEIPVCLTKSDKKAPNQSSLQLTNVSITASRRQPAYAAKKTDWSRALPGVASGNLQTSAARTGSA